MDSFVPANSGEEPSLFQGIDTTIPESCLRRRNTPAAARFGLRTIADQVYAAQKTFEAGDPLRSRHQSLQD